MTTLGELIGKTIVGYRYGDAPESGHSWNYAENSPEAGVSMAQVGYYPEFRSFAISDAAANRKRCYFIGTICDTGGDDEICLENVRRLSYKEYLALRKQYVAESNAVVDYYIGRKISHLESELWNIQNNTFDSRYFWDNEKKAAEISKIQNEIEEYILKQKQYTK